MYFGTMQVVQLQQNYGTLKMVNCAQPSNAPWIFSYQVNLALADVTGTPGTPPPQDDLFSVQQLYLELNTLIDGTVPSISGVSPECMAFVSTYVDAYVKSIPAGQSTISYTQTYQPNQNPPATLVVTSLQYAVLPNSTEPGLGTLNYLCMAQDNAPPANIVYPQWTWVASGNQASGVMAIERGVFFNYLLNIFNKNFNLLSVETTGAATWTDKPADCKAGMNFSYVIPAPGAATWILNTDTTSPVIATASYTHSSGNQHTYGTNCTWFMGSVSCNWDYTLTGQLSYSNDDDGTAHILMNLTLISPVHVHFCGKSEDKNVVNITATIDYAVSVSNIGELIVQTVVPPPINTSQTIPQLTTNCGNINFGSCNAMYAQLDQNLANQLSAYESAVLQALQGATAWYFPGSSTFSFENIAFSQYGDLTVELVYDEPTANGAGNPGLGA